MIDGLLVTLTLIAALGCGLMAGAFFVFSTFVTRALARLPPPEGIAAMQSINVAAINPLFMAALFGTAAACLALGGSSLFAWEMPDAAFLLTGSLLYLLGAVLVTIAFNVPRNDALAAADLARAESAGLWDSYVTSWTAWNHVRTVAALAAAAALTIALLY